MLEVPRATAAAASQPAASPSRPVAFRHETLVGGEYLPALLSELGAHETIDEDVAAAIDDEEEVTDTDQDEGPHGKAVGAVTQALHGPRQSVHLVDVQENPGEVAYQKHQDEAHENSCQVILKVAAALVRCLNLQMRRRTTPSL